MFAKLRTILKEQRWLYSWLRICFAIALAFALCQTKLDYIESLFQDVRVRLRPAPQQSGHLQTIVIDKTTVSMLGRTPNAEDHIKLLSKLHLAKAVVYLVNPVDLTGSFDDRNDFAKAAEALGNFVYAYPAVWTPNEDGAYRLAPPFEKLKYDRAPFTSDTLLLARDGVTRRMITSFQNVQMLFPKLAGLYNPDVLVDSKIRGSFNFYESNQVYIEFRPSQTYKPISFLDVSDEKFDPEVLKDKIVLVGRDLLSTKSDYVATPYSRDATAMSFLEMYANSIDTLILNNGPVPAPKWLDLLLTALISILTLYLVLAVKPGRGLLLLAFTISGFFLFGLLTYWWGGLLIGMAHPFLSIFVCYYFFIPYRLIMENRRSWEYYQKNQLLTQVEELKTNFLSMMSHDLKTPLARIQGMTDVVLKDANPLSSTQMEALLTLRKSSEELLEFISSILNLGRIESKEIQLHLQGKDVNALLSEIVQKSEFMARQKKIELVTELEPLFSVKMDVDLMRQVFSNLVENAIKYSPQGTRVLVSTEERDGWVIVQVADQGQGIPADEIGHVFMKFYRSKNAKSSTIKGSGLGLYLAKYFVELHQGRISVESEPGQGSTFTVELPTESAGKPVPQ